MRVFLLLLSLTPTHFRRPCDHVLLIRLMTLAWRKGREEGAREAGEGRNNRRGRKEREGKKEEAILEEEEEAVDEEEKEEETGVAGCRKKRRDGWREERVRNEG